MDHGEFETQDGNILLLKKNSQVFFTTLLIYQLWNYTYILKTPFINKLLILEIVFIKIENLNLNFGFFLWLDNKIGRKHLFVICAI